jgi:hypothetical protein
LERGRRDLDVSRSQRSNKTGAARDSGCIGFSVQGATTKLLAWIGDVLYWLGCILAAVVVVWGAVFCLRDNSADDSYLFSLVAVAAFAIWVIGLACRYLLSGK